MSRTIQQVVGELGISEKRYQAAVDALVDRRRRLVRLWSYYRNPMRMVAGVTDRSERPYRQAQEWGIPPRITGYEAGIDPLHDGAALADIERKEVVVENDIAWRIDTQVDYLFGRMPKIRSLAADESTRERIEELVYVESKLLSQIKALSEIDENVRDVLQRAVRGGELRKVA